MNSVVRATELLNLSQIEQTINALKKLREGSGRVFVLGMGEALPMLVIW